MTSLNDRFEGLSVACVPFRPRAFPINKVALGFINAMKRQAIEDCDQHISSYTYTDTEYEDSPIRIRINEVAYAPQERLVNCNLMYAIKTLAIKQLTHQRLFGASFLESYQGQPLYSGIFDNKSDVTSLEQTSNSLADPNEAVIRDKGVLSTLSLDSTNSTTFLLTIPGSSDVAYNIEFKFQGSRILKVGIFSAILEFLMTLAQRDSDDAIQSVSQATSTDSIWIFVMKDSEARFALEVFELVAILESLARQAVLKRRYQEMTFKFFIDGVFVARGCVTAPFPSRMWCEGLMEGD